MRGLARTYGAITFVNALFTGTGSAAAIELPVHTTVELEPGPEPLEFEKPSTPLVQASVVAALRTFSAERGGRARVSVQSSVPVARGLKSSSAVSTGVVAACAASVGVAPTATVVAQLSAEASRQVGVSATGAFDDALAACSGGTVVTDNSSTRVLRTDQPFDHAPVAILVPDSPHDPAPEYLDRFRRRRSEAASAAQAALEGNYALAMERNTQLVEQILGLDYGPTRTALRGLGATAAGVSGLGPSLAVVCSPGSVAAVEAALRAQRGQVIVTRMAPRVRPPGAGAA